MDLIVAAGDVGDGFGVGDVLFDEDALGEGVRVVGFEDGYGALEDDGAVIEVLVDEVDGAAGDFYSVVEGLLLRIEAGKGGKQRWVDVEDAVGEGGDEGGREQSHIAGEADEVHVVLAQAGDEVAVVLGAGAALGDQHRRGEIQVAGGLDAGGIGDVGDRYRDFDPLKLPSPDRIGDGKKVGATAGEEDAEFGGVRGHGRLPFEFGL